MTLDKVIIPSGPRRHTVHLRFFTLHRHPNIVDFMRVISQHKLALLGLIEHASRSEIHKGR